MRSWTILGNTSQNHVNSSLDIAEATTNEKDHESLHFANNNHDVLRWLQLGELLKHIVTQPDYQKLRPSIDFKTPVGWWL